jgi:dipeptidyl aminopeptidase/acylaminoacyl peptidase
MAFPRLPLNQSLVALALSLSLATAVPTAAETIVIDPFAPPMVTLPPDEAARLETLLSASFVPLISDVSPDDRTVLTATPSDGVTFLDLRTKATVPVAPEFYGYAAATQYRWRDRDTLTFVGFDGVGDSFLVSVARATGAVSAAPLALTGFPVSLSMGASRLLVGRTVVVGAASRAQAASGRPVSPFVKRTLVNYRRPGPATFDSEKGMTVNVATERVELAVMELETGEDRPLIQIRPEVGLLDVEWSPDDSRLAVITWRFPDFTRGGVVETESDDVQDGLGRLAPRDNPFFTSSTLDLFSLGRHVRHVDLEPTLPNGEIFLDAVFSTDSERFMVQMWVPGTPRGREFPTWANANRSKFRFYSARGKLEATLARPEIDSPFDLLYFVSDHEAVIMAPFELSYGFFMYDLRSRELRRLHTERGGIYQARATRQSREMVYNFGSFERPYELYKIHVNAHDPRALTKVNEAVAAANRIRADKVRFRLRDGDEREGFLIQRAGAAFPPKDVPLVVWQQGGPTSSMTEDWGGFVEQPFNILPNFDFALLMVPLPGRIGFGARFLDELADRRNFGQVDIDEQAEISKQLIERRYTSREKLGITGCSYGGYFTSQSIVRHPTLYKAANTQCTLLDLVYEFDFGYKAYISYLMGRTLPEDPEEYERDSPVFHAARVKTPTLLFAGTEDFLPFTISQQFHDGINAAGTPADFYQFLGEGHGLGFFNSQFVAGQAQIEWFRKYLAP